MHVRGLPVGCGNPGKEVCAIRDEYGNSLFVKRTTSAGLTSYYFLARDAFNEEAKDGDMEEVGVLGRYEGDDVLRAEYFLIGQTLYPVKK